MLYLASQSPRRRQLLEQIGVAFTRVDVDVPEWVQPDEPADAYVQRVAREKALAGLRALGGLPGAVVLGADTEVVLDGEVFGKPADVTAARAMLLRLSGRPHALLSAVCCTDGVDLRCALSVTDVHFAALDAALLEDYLASGEWQGKAGAYGIQGRAGVLVEHLSGSYTGVMGLPVFETAALLRGFGIRPGG